MDTVIFLALTLMMSVAKITSEKDLRTGKRGPMVFTVEIENKETLCFHEKFKESTRYIFEFEVLRGGRNDINVKLESPNGFIIYKEQRRTKGKIPFITSYGIFKFCFSNEFSPISHKLVHFELKTEEFDSLQREAGDTKPSVNTQIEESMEAIHQHNSEVVQYQRENRVLEFKDRYNADQLNKRVQWWSLFQMIVIFVAGCGQVFMLRTFFAEKHTLTMMATTPDEIVSGPNQLLSNCLVDDQTQILPSQGV